MAIPGAVWAATGAELAGLIFLQGFAGPRVPRGFYPVNSAPLMIPCTLEEQHLDRLMITEHPTETGTAITDHSYVLPNQVTIRCGWSDAPTLTNLSLAAIPADVVGGVAATLNSLSGGTVIDTYNQLLQAQKSRQPMSIITGKRPYLNMLIESLAVITDKTSETALMVTAICREIILVNTATINVGSQPTTTASQSADPSIDVGRPAWPASDPNSMLYPNEGVTNDTGTVQLITPAQVPQQAGVTYIPPYTGAPVGP